MWLLQLTGQWRACEGSSRMFQSYSWDLLKGLLFGSQTAEHWSYLSHQWPCVGPRAGRLWAGMALLGRGSGWRMRTFQVQGSGVFTFPQVLF